MNDNMSKDSVLDTIDRAIAILKEKNKNQNSLPNEPCLPNEPYIMLNKKTFKKLRRKNIINHKTKDHKNWVMVNPESKIAYKVYIVDFKCSHWKEKK